MNGFFEYISQFLPIFIGIGVMLLLRSVNAGRNKIRIEVPRRDSSLAPIVEAQEEKEGVPEDILHTCFEKEARERLIVEGAFGKRERSKGLGKLALSKLGMLEMDNLDMMWSYGVVPNDKPLTILIRSHDDFINRISTFGRPAGILLAYMVEYRLELLSR